MVDFSAGRGTDVFLVAVAVGLALLANLTSMLWAIAPAKWGWLAVTLLLSPLVFLSFGFVASRLGLAVAAATVDALLVVATVVLGLLYFREWERVSAPQGLGVALALCGVALMTFGTARS
ncbi:MAG TPA: hypothetical protein VEX38_05640 [Fimbriimonadaceae bacterium]|nr:hypothetical protein [Fimbriimonadaceae bacterium]